MKSNIVVYLVKNFVWPKSLVSILTTKSLLFKNVAPENSAPKWQFVWNNETDVAKNGFMLNTDVELFYDLTLDSDAKATCQLDTSCGLKTPDTCSGSCPKASTFDQALAYSKVTKLD